MGKSAVILTGMAVRAVNCPADPCDPFDHWTLVTVHHSMPNCHVTTWQTIYQSRFLQRTTFICISFETLQGGKQIVQIVNHLSGVFVKFYVNMLC